MNRLRKPSENFTMVPNALIRDGRLSLKAKGVYCILFSKPDGWVYVEPALVEESADGRDAFRAAVKELIETGWLEKRQAQDETGRFSRIDWVLSADGKPVAGKPVDGLAVAGESAPINTDQIKTEGERDIPPVSPIQPERKATRRVNQPGQRLEQHLAANNLGDGCPPDFWPYAAQLGFTGDAIEHIWRNFARYWNSADARGGGRKRDWPATWQNWVNREARDGRGGRGAGKAAGGGLTAALAASLASRYGAGGGSGGLGGRAEGSGPGADPGIRYDSDGERIIPF